MPLLAIERSSAVADIAIYRGGLCLYHATASAADGTPADTAALAAVALAHVRLRPEAITRVAVGLGPGSFSGIRAALAFAQGFALPGRRPIVGIGSAAALAWMLLRDGGGRSAPVAVVGDARRGLWWAARYARHGTTLRELAPVALTDPDAWFAGLPPDADVATPDWARLESELRRRVPPDRLLTGAQWPTAAAVAELALDPAAPRVAPPLPIYLHPAVAAR